MEVGEEAVGVVMAAMFVTGEPVKKAMLFFN